MPSFTHRERVRTALNFKEPDRVPISFGSCMEDSIVEEAYEKLKEKLKITNENKYFHKRGKLVSPDEEILEQFNVDTRGVYLGKADSFVETEEIGGEFYKDELGVLWKKSTKGGHYINFLGPFENIENPTIKDLENYKMPDPDDPGRYRELIKKAKYLYKNTDYAIVLDTTIGVIHAGEYLRGFSKWLEDVYLNPEFIKGLTRKYLDYWKRTTENCLKKIGKYVDIVFFGDDVAMQTNSLISIEKYREIIKPAHREFVETVKKYSTAKVAYHTCGAVYNFIGDFIDIGIDILNPIQVSAVGMDTKKLKKEFGKKICFMGAIDTQHVLPFGSEKEVEEEVKKRINELGEGGGYLLSSVHDIQAEVPPNNIITMFNSALKYGQYQH